MSLSIQQKSYILGRSQATFYMNISKLKKYIFQKSIKIYKTCAAARYFAVQVRNTAQRKLNHIYYLKIRATIY